MAVSSSSAEVFRFTNQSYAPLSSLPSVIRVEEPGENH
jgi:hypothetical protein